ncbi:hypothetical protein C8R44DRAFT_741868 [Mycena epipterygia]|nr:hypothetical protein C8R44DRAFT_741868 [Mycena epipterygia]
MDVFRPSKVKSTRARYSRCRLTIDPPSIHRHRDLRRSYLAITSIGSNRIQSPPPSSIFKLFLDDIVVKSIVAAAHVDGILGGERAAVMYIENGAPDLRRGGGAYVLRARRSLFEREEYRSQNILDTISLAALQVKGIAALVSALSLCGDINLDGRTVQESLVQDYSTSRATTRSPFSRSQSQRVGGLLEALLRLFAGDLKTDIPIFLAAARCTSPSFSSRSQTQSTTSRGAWFDIDESAFPNGVARSTLVPSSLVQSSARNRANDSASGDTPLVVLECARTGTPTAYDGCMDIDGVHLLVILPGFSCSPPFVGTARCSARKPKTASPWTGGAEAFSFAHPPILNPLLLPRCSHGYARKRVSRSAAHKRDLTDLECAPSSQTRSAGLRDCFVSANANPNTSLASTRRTPRESDLVLANPKSWTPCLFCVRQRQKPRHTVRCKHAHIGGSGQSFHCWEAFLAILAGFLGGTWCCYTYVGRDSAARLFHYFGSISFLPLCAPPSSASFHRTDFVGELCDDDEQRQRPASLLIPLIFSSRSAERGGRLARLCARPP